MFLQGMYVFPGQSFRVLRDSTLAVQVSRILLSLGAVKCKQQRYVDDI